MRHRTPILFESDLPKGARGFVGAHDKMSRFRNEKEAFSIPGMKFVVTEIRRDVIIPETESRGIVIRVKPVIEE